MAETRIGVWFIGAWGRVATAAVVRLAMLQQSLRDEPKVTTTVDESGIVEYSPRSVFVVGGHEIRRTSYLVEAHSDVSLMPKGDGSVLSAVEPTLRGFDRNVRTGTLLGISPAARARASTATVKLANERPLAAIDRVAFDIEAFGKEHLVAHTIVANLATPEPEDRDQALDALNWSELSRLLEQDASVPLRASSIYAIAAIQCKASYLNGTTSVGADLKFVDERARECGTLLSRYHLDALDVPSAADRLLELLRLTEWASRSGKTGLIDVSQSPTPWTGGATWTVH